MLKRYVTKNVKTYDDVIKFGQKMGRLLKLIRLSLIVILCMVSSILTQAYLAPWFGLTEWGTDTAEFMKYMYLMIVSNVTFFGIIACTIIIIFDRLVLFSSARCAKLVLKVFDDRGDMGVMVDGMMDSLLNSFGSDEGTTYDDTNNDWGEYEE